MSHEDWRWWPRVVLRSAGFPARDLTSVSDSGLAAHDLSSPDLAAHYEKVSNELTRRLQRLAGGARFETAFALQNHAAFQRAIPPYLAWNPGDQPRRKNYRRRENLVAAYLQRYCAKNDSVGFFGPVGIGQCSALLGLAAVDIRRDEPQRARQHLAEARELAAVAGDPTIDSQTTLTLAEAELAVGEFEAAAEHADKALREFEEQGMALFHVRSLIIRGHIYRALSSPHLAMTVWKTAAQLLSRLKLRQTSTLCEEVNALIADIE